MRLRNAGRARIEATQPDVAYVKAMRFPKAKIRLTARVLSDLCRCPAHRMPRPFGCLVEDGHVQCLLSGAGETESPLGRRAGFDVAQLA